MSFAVDPSIEAVSSALAPLIMCEARLMQDARYVWVILIPRREGLVELDDLHAEARVAVFEEAVRTGEAVRRIAAELGRPVEKLNTAALGNVTRQLHLHVVGRRSDDAAWPRPVWGVGEAVAWSADEVAAISAAWEAAHGL